jgi:hypothetical protein
MRYLVLGRTSWDQMVPHDEVKQSIFDEGNLHEKAVLRELDEAGIDVIEQQVALDWPDYDITGHIDGMIKSPEDGLLVPLEIKSMSPHAYHRLAHCEDLMYELMHGPWYWKNYPTQLLLYCLMKDKPYGVWIFKDKLTGQKVDRVLELEPNLDYAEGILKKAEEINIHLSMGTVPEPIEELTICEDCGFYGYCHPDNIPDGQLTMLTELEYYLDLAAELKVKMRPMERELKMVDAEIKARLKDHNAMVMAGKWRLTPKVIQVKARSGYEYTKWNRKKLADEDSNN